MSLRIGLDGRDAHDVVLTRSGENATLWIDGVAHLVRTRTDGTEAEIAVDDRREQVWVVTHRDTVFVHAAGRAWRLEVTDPVEQSLKVSGGSDAATAPMPGTVVEVAVAAGDDVTTGQALAVIESMKMHTTISAWRDGRVERVVVAVGDTFDTGAPLVTLEPLDLEGDTA